MVRTTADAAPVPAYARGTDAGAPAPVWAVAACALLGLCPVGALVAWAYRLGSFAAWFWGLSLPASLALLAIGTWAGRRNRPWHPWLGRFFAHGVVGGVLGAVAYDLVRIPFLLVGLRLLSPIDSYGVLMAGASTSSPLTSFLGWCYHFSDGIGFGIAYAVVMRGRNWKWGLVWGSTLESISLVTPLGGFYGLRSSGLAIFGAYLGHLAYGAVLGKTVELAGPVGARAGRVPLSPRTPAVVLLALLGYLLAWLRPWTVPVLSAEAATIGPAPATVVAGGKFHPEWLRVADGGCVSVRDDDTSAYSLTSVSGHPELAPGRVTRVCLRGAGVHRVKTSGRPWSGGFVLVDPARS